MRTSAEHAIKKFRDIYGKEDQYKILVMGSLHGIDFKYHTQIDWTGRGEEGNANWKYDEINNGDWDVIVNLCCEHMYPMKAIDLPSIHLLQSNNRYSDTHINRVHSMDEFIMQAGHIDIEYYDISHWYGYEYYTLVGEKIAYL